MNKKLWVVTVVYTLLVAIPAAVAMGAGLGEWVVGFLTFIASMGMYTTVLLLVMGIIDYAKVN